MYVGTCPSPEIPVAFPGKRATGKSHTQKYVIFKTHGARRIHIMGGEGENRTLGQEENIGLMVQEAGVELVGLMG